MMFTNTQMKQMFLIMEVPSLKVLYVIMLTTESAESPPARPWEAPDPRDNSVGFDHVIGQALDDRLVSGLISDGLLVSRIVLRDDAILPNQPVEVLLGPLGFSNS